MLEDTFTLTLTARQVILLRSAIDTHLTHARSVCGFDLDDDEDDELNTVDYALACFQVFGS